MAKETRLVGETPNGDESITFAHHAEAVWEHREPYGPSGFAGLFASNYYASLCAAFAAIGGMIFGYDQVIQAPKTSISSPPS